ncbi:transposase [Carnobacterium iners]
MDPIQSFKYLLLKSIYNLSDRDLVERAKFTSLFSLTLHNEINYKLSRE